MLRGAAFCMPGRKISSPVFEHLMYTQRLIRAAHHANSFGPEIIYPPEGGVWRFCVKPANGRLALAIFFVGLAVFSTASAQTPAVHKPQRQPGASTLEGQWSGSLPAGEAILHVVLHVSRVEDGSFKASIDSLEDRKSTRLNSSHVSIS